MQKQATNVDVAPTDKGLFLTWTDGDGKSKGAAFSKMYEALEKSQIHHAHASDVYKDIYTGNVSIRDEFTLDDYELYRPSDRLPKSDKAKIKAAMDVYYVGIIRNVIDLMGDFTVQGIDLAHPKRKVQAWFKNWWKLVHGKERSERLANYLARISNVVVKRETGKLTVKQNHSFMKTNAGPSDPVKTEEVYDLEKREIPVRYIFLNPMNLEVIGDELATFVDSSNLKFGINLPQSLCSKINYPSNEQERQIVAQLPKDIVNAVRSGQKKIPLDNTKIKVSYYKKDDWSLWAVPLTCSVLPQIKTLEKMQLADRAALDGAISQIRLWTIGSLDHKIVPNDAAINKLANVLVNSVGGGIVDLIWGPDLQLKETTTTLHNFLGETKYVPVLNAIYAGLGIPPLFTGASAQGSFTNNFLAIKTFIEKLQYIRDRVIEFWEAEIALVQKAMGFEEPAYLVFDRMTLNDEASILTLITGLVDRNIISEEYAQEMVGAIPEIETFRIKREERERNSGKKTKKAGPFHTSDPNQEYKKMFIQHGTVTPSQVGLELDANRDGEISPAEQNAKTQMELAKVKAASKPKVKGISGQGRPKNKKDKIKRKQKEVKPRRSVSSFMQANAWAEEAQTAVSNYFTPIYLKSLSKKNLRQLTEIEFDSFENFKFAILCNLKAGQEVNNQVLDYIVKQKIEIPKAYDVLLAKTLSVFKEKNHRPANAECRRRFQAQVYSLFNSETYVQETNNSNNGSSPIL